MPDPITIRLRTAETAAAEALDDNRRLTKERDEAVGLLRLAVNDTLSPCDHLHHEPKDRHRSGKPCPILVRMVAFLARIDAKTKEAP